MVGVTCVLTLIILLCMFDQSTLVSAGIDDAELYDDQQDENIESTTNYIEQKEYDTEPIDIGLRLVQVLYRHGDRSPVHSYPKDIYKESDWPQGYGQLSIVGMQQEYLLGEFLRRRYMIDNEFLSPDYVNTEIYVRSTAYERALMSAYSVLAGLYPPTNENSQWNARIPWQPIPVHTDYPKENDTFLVTDTSCPKFEAEKNHFMENNIIKTQIMKELSDLFNLVSERAGVENTWEGVGSVFDPLYCQRASGYQLPDWVTEEVFEQILYLRDIDAGLNCPQHIAYLKAGLLVGEMLDHMMSKSKNNISTPQKMFMYSAHDSNIECLLSLLGVSVDKHPPYTACVIVELLEPNPSEFYVQISYKNNTPGDADQDNEPFVLTLPNCDALCPLEIFAQLVDSSIPRDLQTECSLSQENNFSHESSTIVKIFLVCSIVFGVVVFIIIMCCLSKKSHDYMPVPLEMS